MCPWVSRTHLELIFLASKIATIIFGYLAPHTSPVLASAVLLLMSAATLHQHISQMPFRHHRTNLLRGGIHAAVTWAAFATVVVSILSLTPAAGSWADQTLEWALISATGAHVSICQSFR